MFLIFFSFMFLIFFSFIFLYFFLSLFHTFLNTEYSSRTVKTEIKKQLSYEIVNIKDDQLKFRSLKSAVNGEFEKNIIFFEKIIVRKNFVKY